MLMTFMRLSCFVLKLSYFVLQTCSYLVLLFFFFFFLLLPDAELPGWKFWPTQRTISTSLDPGSRLFSFLSSLFQIACLMLSSHLYLCLSRDLLVRGFQLNIFLTVLVSGIHCTWPNQLSFVLQTCSYFLHFVPGAELHSWKFWPSQQTLSTSLDPGHGLSSYWSSFGRFPVLC